MNINLTLFGQMVTFAIFVWFCMKFVWPVILTSLEERQKKIEDGLNFAEKATRELAETKLEIDRKIDDAKIVSSRLFVSNRQKYFRNNIIMPLDERCYICTVRPHEHWSLYPFPA